MDLSFNDCQVEDVTVRSPTLIIIVIINLIHAGPIEDEKLSAKVLSCLIDKAR